MRILELKKQHYENVKTLLVELQNYIVKIDKYKLNIVNKDYKEKYFEYMLNDCKNFNGKVFVAYENNQVVGMIAGFVMPYNERDYLDYKCPKKAVISELIVSKSLRCGGVGTKLLNKMENYLKTIGCTYCELDVFAYNKTAINFYFKNGYDNRMITMFKKL